MLFMAEILHQLMQIGSLSSHYLQAVLHPNGGFLAGFLVAINRSFPISHTILSWEPKGPTHPNAMPPKK